MPTTTIPLVANPAPRGIDSLSNYTKDQRFVNCIFNFVQNPATQENSIYIEKRPGFQSVSTIDSGKGGREICDNYGFISLSGPLTVFKAGGASSPNFYIGSTLIGTGSASALAYAVTAIQARINDEEMYLISTNQQGGWFIGETGMSGGTTFTADTNSNTSLTNVSSTTGLVAGQEISGTDIDGGTRIVSISGTTVTIDTPATGTTVGVTITRERISKIIDTDFPTNMTGMFSTMDGYIFAAERGSQRIYQSALNDPTSWDANIYVSADDTPGYILGTARIGKNIVAVKTDGFEFFENTGNASGSVLSRIKAMTIRLGVSVDSGSGLFSGTNKLSYDYLDDLVAFCFDGVYLLDGAQVKKISNQYISRIVSQNIATVRIFSNEFGRYIFVTSVDVAGVDYYFIYDINTGLWSEILPPGSDGQSIVFSRRLGFSVFAGIDAGMGTSGDYFNWDGTSPVYTDDGSAFTMTLQTQPYALNNGEGFTINRISLLADNQASGTTAIYTSKDDYGTWVSKGSFDMTSTKKEIHRGGFYRSSCAFKLEHSANTAWRGQAIVVDWEPAVT